jgi:ABC-type transport system involved in Fe-S cluster assembly fused permease/ATPase subunit
MDKCDFLDFLGNVFSLVVFGIYAVVSCGAIFNQVNTVDTIGWIFAFILNTYIIIAILAWQYDDFKKWKSTLPVKDV